MKIKNRKMELHQINVVIWGAMSRTILVTSAQLVKLNKVPVGKEFFLSRYYCYSHGDFWAIRTRDGLQYMPNPYNGDPLDITILGNSRTKRASDLNTSEPPWHYEA